MTGWWAGVTMIIGFALLVAIPVIIVLSVIHPGAHH